MNKLILGVICFALMGCSAKQAIYDGAAAVDRLARSSEASAVEISEITTQPEVATLADSIVADQVKIQEKAESIKEATTHVKDIVPWWAQLLELGALVLLVAAALYFTWVYVVPIRMFVGRFLPSRRRAAQMLRKVSSGTIEPREYIAQWRTDPANDAAYRAEKKKEALRAQ